MSTCPRCKSENDGEASYCSRCGGPLDPARAPAPVAPPIAGSELRGARLEAYPAAPRVRRMVAAVIDIAIGSIFLIPVAAMPFWMGPFMKGNLFTKLLRFIPALYLLLRDSLAGRSIGKALMGLVTYDRNLKRPANVIDSVVRNWPLVLTLIPWVGWILSGVVAAIMAVQILIGRSQRLGDGFAETQVIDEKWLQTD